MCQGERKRLDRPDAAAGSENGQPVELVHIVSRSENGQPVDCFSQPFSITEASRSPRARTDLKVSLKVVVAFEVVLLQLRAEDSRRRPCRALDDPVPLNNLHQR